MDYICALFLGCSVVRYAVQINDSFDCPNFPTTADEYESLVPCLKFEEYYPFDNHLLNFLSKSPLAVSYGGVSTKMTLITLPSSKLYVQRIELNPSVFDDKVRPISKIWQFEALLTNYDLKSQVTTSLATESAYCCFSNPWSSNYPI